LSCTCNGRWSNILYHYRSATGCCISTVICSSPCSRCSISSRTTSRGRCICKRYGYCLITCICCSRCYPYWCCRAIDWRCLSYTGNCWCCDILHHYRAAAGCCITTIICCRPCSCRSICARTCSRSRAIRECYGYCLITCIRCSWCYPYRCCRAIDWCGLSRTCNCRWSDILYHY